MDQDAPALTPPPRCRRIKGRWYWWPTPAVQKLGFASVPLGAEAAAAFAQAAKLNALVERERLRAVLPPPPPDGSMTALIRLYHASPDYRRLAPATARNYDKIIAEIDRNAGDLAVAAIARKDLKVTYRALLPRGLAIAAAHMRVWRILLGLAYDEGWRPDNPARALRLQGAAPRRVVWTRPQIDAFVAAARQAGRPSLALAVLLAWDLGQREGDVLALPWSAYQDGAFLIRQAKTGTLVRVPARQALIAALAETPRASPVILVCESTGRPWRDHHFRHAFAAIRAAANLPPTLQFRDLRRTAATELGNAGATDDEIRAVTGHLSRNVVAVYVQPTGDQARAAQAKRTERSDNPK